MELMVVLAVIGLLGATVLLTAPQIGGGPHRDADTLAARLAHARDEAILSTRPVRADIDADGYRFAIAHRSSWQPLAGAGLAPTTWARGVAPALRGDTGMLSITFDPLGGTAPVVVALGDGQATAQVHVAADGRVHVAGAH